MNSQPNARPAITAQSAVDLHMHTIYSDGHWTPTALCDYLAANGFALVAVTDHDRVDTVDEVRALGATRGLTIVPGVEVTTSWRDGITHLLCLGFDPAGGALATVTQGVRDGQLANARAVNAALQRRGFAFPHMATVLADKGGALNHPLDNITLLREHGYAPDFQAGLRLVREAGHRTVAAPLAEAVAAAHADGGLAIIAHPGRHESETWYDPPVLDDLRADAIPVDGLEAYYPRHSPDQVRAYAEYCASHGWLASSGSDSHGPRQRYPIAYPAGQVAPLLARLGYPVTA